MKLCYGVANATVEVILAADGFISVVSITVVEVIRDTADGFISVVSMTVVPVVINAVGLLSQLEPPIRFQAAPSNRYRVSVFVCANTEFVGTVVGLVSEDTPVKKLEARYTIVMLSPTRSN